MKKRYFSILLVFALVLSLLGVCGTCVITYSLEENVNWRDTQTETTKIKENPKVVAIVPIKLNNQRCPGKNIKNISNDTPLIHCILSTLKKAKNIDDIYVYCSNEDIKQYLLPGIKFLKRSTSLDSDDTSMNEVLAAFANQVESDIYVLSHATAPFLTVETINACIDNVLNDKNDSALTVYKLNEFLWKDGKPINYTPERIPRTQDLAPLYAETSGLYVFRKNLIKFENRRVGNNPYIKEVGAIEAIDIDTPDDFTIASGIYNSYLNKKRIKILDCTLRDGGYINNWNFGKENIEGTINKLADSGADIIECGFFKPNSNYNDNQSLFDKLNRIDGCKEIKDRKLCVMLNYGDCKIDDVPRYNGERINTIRVCFHKENAANAMNFCKGLKEKGYNVFIQPMQTTRYSNKELLDLIKASNEFLPKAFYIVDSCGIMDKDDITKMFNIMDENLDPSISIGFHSHNNLQLSYANARALMDVDTNRNIIIDSSVFGMGRGSGNLCTELLMQDLNEKYGEKYDLSSIYKIFDEHLNSTFEKTPWGYSIPLFISAKYKCHPNYAIFLKDRGLKSNTDIDKIISRIENNKKSLFDKAYIEKLYNDFFNCKQYDCITFDLDGTIIDSSEGMFNAIRHAEEALGIEPLPEDKLKLCVGPTLKYTYGVLHELNEELTNKAINIHKEYMSQQGYKQCKLYDGIDDLLKTLKNKNIKLAIATLKQEFIANQTLKYLGIDKYFDMILGQNGSESLEKSDLLKEISKKFNTKNIVLIGDTKFDAEAALKAGIDFIAVTYGMGFRTANDAETFSPVKVYSSISNVKELGGIYVLK